MSRFEWSDEYLTGEGLIDDAAQQLADWMESRLIPHVMKVDPRTIAEAT